jgi:hypothetical protein
MGDETETHLSQLAALENFANHREFFGGEKRVAAAAERG